MVNFKILGMHCEEMQYKLNVIKAEPSARFEIKPEFNRLMKKIKEQPRRRILELSVRIESTEASPKPFDIFIRLVVSYELEEEIWLKEDENEFMVAATRHAFPYLRSAISSLTASAMITPLMLPPLDGSMLFPEDRKE